MKRRDFISKTTTGSIAAGIGMEHISNNSDAQAARYSPRDDKPLVTIAASNEPELRTPAPIDAPDLTYEQVRDVVWLALDRDTSPRSLLNIVKKDQWVVIKTNIVRIVWLSQEGYWGQPGLAPDFEREDDALSLVTDLRVVKAVAEYLIEKIGPKRISIAEGPAEWYKADGNIKPGNYVDGWHYEFAGYDNLSYVKIAEQLNGKNGSAVDIIDLNEDEGVYVTEFDPHNTGIQALQFTPAGDADGTSDAEPSRRKGVYIPRTMLEKDILITVPVLKTHGSVGTTLYMKNFIGCVHSTSYDPMVTHKGVFHKGSDFNLIRGIVDLTTIMKPDYGVAEGFWAVMSHHHGQKGIGINHNIVIAGGDVVAAESIANSAMGYNPLDFDILRLANMKKLGEWRPDKIETAGPPVKSVRINYTRSMDKYVARGVRKWYMLGPVREPVDNPAELEALPGVKIDGKEWLLLDGDAVIDNEPLVVRKRYKECLLYPIPGSGDTDKDSCYYLYLKIHGKRKGLVGQLLVGLDNAEFRAFVNGSEMPYESRALRYDPNPSKFITLLKGENTLVLEVKKTAGKKDPVKIAVNICNHDGDRLEDIVFEPAGE